MLERSPLHGLAQLGRYGRADGAPGLVIEEITGMAFATVIARKSKTDDLLRTVRGAFGVTPVAGPRRVSKGDITFAGTGPGQWIASADAAQAAGFVAQLRLRIAPMAAVMDQSDARLVLRLSGPRVREVLAKGVPIDLHPRTFKTDDVATTLIAHVSTQIDMLDDTPAYQLAAPRSMAGSFWSWLTASAAEFGYEILPPRA